MTESMSFRLDFRHKGASCPHCRYVFVNGFSTMVDADGTPLEHSNPIPGVEGELTLCTRCGRVLLVEGDGTLRGLTPDEIAALPKDAQRNMSVIRCLLAAYNARNS